ncbi:MAG: Gfo/Idh/MocA family oxidoreductase [Gammaproteobacteria bacterium]|nr:Gfo/Idh/MocA family oxidoreductase [Gammaproteobacteria bacterium]NIM73073.1 Gfo/Idh/MocA family oxidoreductase [Gammaproteobacteria bacterium]NIN38690.1 Gfo/Idh/MocA family oxidoreductase [Gammaproteobacteria bacterium]NIO24826.1 Gfo/Idh/MocA family oxidoreductase [Gammaproteobacteria bacterium]NIO65429.1 Gfo/Idh/MocA family oxidoreductase [Gammaproteobacteria bacterium]
MSLNIAMLGTGRIADQELAPALARVDGAQLWSVLSRDPGRGKAFAERHGAAAASPVHTDLQHLLADDELDAVLIATPDKLHAAQCIAAARAAKHVLTEKPMATDIVEAQAMIDACEEAGVVLAVAYHMRWHAGHRKLAGMVHEGRLGTLRHVRAQWTSLAPNDQNWRASPEVGRWWGLAGVGTHCLDQIRWLMTPSCGEIVAQSNLISREVWKGPHDETALVSLQFESGATAEICTSVLFNAPKRMEVFASDTYAVCDDTFGPHGSGVITIGGEPMAYEVVNPYVGEITDFVAAVRDGRAPEVDGREGLRNVATLVAAVSDVARH